MAEILGGGLEPLGPHEVGAYESDAHSISAAEPSTAARW